MTKILFVYPPYLAPTHVERILAGTEEIAMGAPLGLMYISGYLKKRGFTGTIELLDLMDKVYRDRRVLADDALFEDAIAQHLAGFKPDLIGITLNFSVSWGYFVQISRVIRERLPDATIVVGGGHATFAYKHVLQGGLADYVVRGEGEYAFADLVSALGSGKESTIQGVFDLAKSNTLASDIGEMFNFEDIEMPDWGLVDAEGYTRGNNSFRFLGSRGDVFAQIVTARGCPYQCSYCAASNAYGNKLRYRPVNRVIAEIEWLRNRYGVTGFIPEDDMFISKAERSLQLLKALAADNRGIKIAVRNGLAVSALSEEVVDLMVQANVTTCNVAIDGGTPEMQKQIGKNCDLAKAKRMIRYIRDRGIETCACMIIGHYGETRDLLDAAIEYILSLEADWLNLQVCAPLPGSEFYRLLCRDGIIKDTPDYWNHDYEIREFALNGISGEEISRIRKRTYYRSNYSNNVNIREGMHRRALNYYDRRCEQKDHDLFSHLYQAKCLYALGMGEEAALSMKKVAAIMRTAGGSKTYLENREFVPAELAAAMLEDVGNDVASTS